MNSNQNIFTLDAELQALQATLDQKRADFDALVAEYESGMKSIRERYHIGNQQTSTTSREHRTRPVAANFKSSINKVFNHHPTTESRSVVEPLIQKSLQSVSKKNHCEVPEEILTLVKTKLSAYGGN